MCLWSTRLQTNTSYCQYPPMSRLPHKRGGNSKPGLQNKNERASLFKENNSLSSTDQQLQKEINWCVEQLRMGLFTQKATGKQVQNSERILKILTSTKAPLVKKRQVMHQTFGDYRKKIQETESKWEKDANKQRCDFEIRSCTKAAMSGQGQFVHMSHSASSKEQTTATQDISHRPTFDKLCSSQVTQSDSSTENTFLFNFKIDG